MRLCFALALVAVWTTIVSSPVRADNPEDASVPPAQLGVYATVGGILGTTRYDHHDTEFGNDSAANLTGNLDGEQQGGLVLGAALGATAAVSRRVEVQSRLGFLYQVTGDFDASEDGCYVSGGNCHYEWNAASWSRTLIYLEVTGRVRPISHSTFYAGAGGRLGVVPYAVTFDGTLVDDAPTGPPLRIHEPTRDSYLLAAGLAEVGIVLDRIDVGLRGGLALLTTEDAVATAELTVGYRFF